MLLFFVHFSIFFEKKSCFKFSMHFLKRINCSWRENNIIWYQEAYIYVFDEFSNFRFVSHFCHFQHFSDHVCVLFSAPILNLDMKFAEIKYFYWSVFWKIMFSQNECWNINIFLKFNFRFFFNLSVIQFVAC